MRNVELKPWILLGASIACPILFTVWAQRDAQWGPLIQTRPLLSLNLLLFIFLDLGVYLVSIIEDSTWLIDPLWTVIPQLINLFFLSNSDSTQIISWRSVWVNILLWCWTLRLEHNYMRRENWVLGEKEDWRYFEMRSLYRHHWIWVQFFLVEVLQHGFMFGVSVPLFYVYRSFDHTFNGLDLVFVVLCVSGLCLAKSADDRLFEFMTGKRNKRISPDDILYKFPWTICRHPNYLGEIMFWFGIGCSALAGRGASWVILAGALANALCLVATAELVENRMKSRQRNSVQKLENYAKYCSNVQSKIFPKLW